MKKNIFTWVLMGAIGLSSTTAFAQYDDLYDDPEDFISVFTFEEEEAVEELDLNDVIVSNEAVDLYDDQYNYYTSAIKRFDSDDYSGFNYYDPVFVDLYYYTSDISSSTIYSDYSEDWFGNVEYESAPLASESTNLYYTTSSNSGYGSYGTYETNSGTYGTYGSSGSNGSYGSSSSSSSSSTYNDCPINSGSVSGPTESTTSRTTTTESRSRSTYGSNRTTPTRTSESTNTPSEYIPPTQTRTTPSSPSTPSRSTRSSGSSGRRY